MTRRAAALLVSLFLGATVLTGTVAAGAGPLETSARTTTTVRRTTTTVRRTTTTVRRTTTTVRRATTTTRPTTTTTRPRATSTTAARRCDAAYPTVCIPPPPPDLNCGDITAKNFTVKSPDPHKLDGDRDGIGCES